MSQERKSSGNFQKADIENFHNHNFRITKPSYLLPNEFVTLKNHTVLFHNFDTVFDEQIKIWKDKNKKGGRPPQKANCLQEIVINLKADSKIEDLITISNYIKREYGYIPLEIAIHNDEGFVDKNGKVHYNYHAHIDFCTLQDGIQWCQMEHYCDKVEYTKKNGTKSWRFVSNKDSKLQDFIAETLGMERGQKGSKAKRLEHEQYRQVAQQKQVLKDQIDDLSQRNDLYVELLQSYADSFEINSDSAFEMLKEIGNKATELKELKADKEQQLKQIELLKKKRGVLNKGAKNYRQQKKALKQQITKLNNNITDLEKTIQSLTADKADLSSQLETAKSQILSDQQKADLITNAINSKLENKELYTKQAFDEKEVTKTITKTETQTVTVTKLRDYSEQEKQDLIDNAIKAKIEQGELYTSDDYNNKPLTQKAIKDYIEKNRQAMRQQGIYTADDYKQLGDLKKNLIDKLRLAKKEGFQFTEKEVVDSVTELMTSLENSKKQAQNDLTKAISAYTTFKPKGDTAYQTIKDLSEQINARIEKVEKEQFNEGVKADREYLNKHLNENPQLLHAYDLLNQKYQALENATPTPVEVEVIKEVPRELSDEEIEQLPRVKELLQKLEELKQNTQVEHTQSVQVEQPKPQEPQVEVESEPYVPDDYDEDFINSSMPTPKYPLDNLFDENEKLFSRIVEKVCSECGLNSNKDEDFEKVAQKLDNLRDFDLNEIPNLDFFDDFEVKNEIAKKIIAENSDLQPQKVQILSKKGRSR